MNVELLFSLARLNEYESAKQHFANFRLVGRLAPLINILEVVTRNRIIAILEKNCRLDILGVDFIIACENKSRDKFISKQTFGFWHKIIDAAKIHNELFPNASEINFKEYSKFHKRDDFLNYQKVSIIYNLFHTIRNRAYHCENLLKVRMGGYPRINTRLFGRIVGIEPHRIECFLRDLINLYSVELLDKISKMELAE